MKKTMVLIIILLAVFFVGQLLLDRDTENFAQNVTKPDTNVDVDANTIAKKKANNRRVQNSTNTSSQVFDFPDDGGETVAESNFKHVEESGFSETWDVTDEQALESNVSQAQMNIVRKREMAVQRRDYLMQRRTELVSSMAEEANEAQ